MYGRTNCCGNEIFYILGSPINASIIIFIFIIDLYCGLIRRFDGLSRDRCCCGSLPLFFLPFLFGLLLFFCLNPRCFFPSQYPHSFKLLLGRLNFFSAIAASKKLVGGLFTQSLSGF